MKENRILRNQIRKHLLEQIGQGKLQIGKTIKLASLSRETGISVTPIREALSQLEQARIIEAVPNRGFVVSKLCKDEARNLYETIAQLEILALENTSFSEEDITFLKMQQSRLRQYNSFSNRLTERFEFHRLLVKNCKNLILLQILEDLFARLLFYEHGFKHDIIFLEKFDSQNEAIIQAIEEDNVPTASLILKMNWMTISEFIENQINEN